MALEQMEGFELAGRTVLWDYFCAWIVTDGVCATASREHRSRERSDAIHSAGLLRGKWRYVWSSNFLQQLVTYGFYTGGNLNAASRQALMQKLARTDSAPKAQPM